MATLLTKKSDTASSVPLAADLTNAAGGAELAVNTADKRLYSKTSGGTVVELGTNPSSMTLPSATSQPSGTANGVPYLNGSKVLTSGSALTFDGTNLGLGTATPQNYGAGVTSATIDASSTSSIDLRISGTRYGRVYASTSALNIDTWSGTGPIVFGINTNEQMRLTSTGLGIGTSSPVGKLQVTGTNGSVRIQSGDDLEFTKNGANYISAKGGANGTLVFETGGANERMRLDSSGNLGLGVTPSAWASNGNAQFQKLTFAGNDYSLGSNYYQTAGSVYRYASNDTAAKLSFYNGQFLFYTAPSGTAGNAISFTPAMTLFASGGLAIGATGDPGAGSLVLDGNSGRFTFSAGSTTNTIFSTTTGFGAYNILTLNGSQHVFQTSGTERARIDSSGNLLVGQTARGLRNSNSFDFDISDASAYLNHVNGTASGSTYIYFGYNAGVIGSISQNGTTAVAYNTTSDHRLKENVTPLTGALAKVQALKPSEFDWIDGRHDDGFIAHELQAVLPNVVTGEKDAVDEDGKPKYQQVDYARIVPTLCAAIQEQQSIIEGMKTRLAALESK